MTQWNNSQAVVRGEERPTYNTTYATGGNQTANFIPSSQFPSSANFAYGTGVNQTGGQSRSGVTEGVQPGGTGWGAIRQTAPSVRPPVVTEQILSPVPPARQPPPTFAPGGYPPPFASSGLVPPAPVQPSLAPPLPTTRAPSHAPPPDTQPPVLPLSATLQARVRILLVTWDAAGVRTCETTSQPMADERRRGFLTRFYRKPCTAPEFVNYISNVAGDNRPQLIVVATQNEAEGSQLHEVTLPDVLKNRDYRVLKSYVTSDVGAAGAALNPVPTGDVTLTYLRTTVLADRLTYDQVVVEERALPRSVQSDHVTIINSSTLAIAGHSGTLATYVWLSPSRRLAFLNVYLAPLATRPATDYATYRALTNANNTIALINSYSRLVGELGPESKLTNVFMLGNFGSDIVGYVPQQTASELIAQVTANPSEGGWRQWLGRDELTLRLRTNTPPFAGFSEGVNHQGPTFAPTARLARGRPLECSFTVSANCFEQDNDLVQSSGIGWSDRILHRQLIGAANDRSICLQYSRIDGSGTETSTHAVVLASYDLGE